MSGWKKHYKGTNEATLLRSRSAPGCTPHKKKKNPEDFLKFFKPLSGFVTMDQNNLFASGY
jgi:hypothetical protein